MDEQQAATLKEGARVTWAAGDFDVVAELILEVGRDVVERVGVGPGQRVLDIAAGTGNASVPAAVAGAEVVASDLTPELFEAGRRRAAEAGVEIEWVEADAEALPFEDGSFDVVISTFGIMFAPRHDVAAAEALRVLKPGGRMGLCCWRPDGRIGRFFATIASHMPPPPEGFMPPPLWGVRDHVRGLFPTGEIELEFEDREVAFLFDSAEAAKDLYAETFGPVIKARELLEPEGRWPALERDLVELYEVESVPVNGRISYGGEYLMTIGDKAG